MARLTVEKCPICGKGIMSAMECPKHAAAIHAAHCGGCDFYVAEFSHCQYRQDELIRRRLEEVKKAKQKKRDIRRQAFIAAIGGAPSPCSSERRGTSCTSRNP